MDKTVELLLAAVQEAGEAIFSMQRSGFAIERKANQDLVTEADYLANDILKKKLLGAFPNDAWLSEESVDDPSRLAARRVWIVDPIDGTKEFASGMAEYAISVALIENGQPILAAVCNPASGELFHAVKGQGAWLGQERIRCREKAIGAKPLILASRSEYMRGEWTAFEKDYEIKQVGSIAYKLGLIAKGLADATFSLGPKNEWDIAAGVLLVSEAGGIVHDALRKPFIFNREKVLVDGIIASSAVVYEEIMAEIALIEM